MGCQEQDPYLHKALAELRTRLDRRRSTRYVPSHGTSIPYLARTVPVPVHPIRDVNHEKSPKPKSYNSNYTIVQIQENFREPYPGYSQALSIQKRRIECCIKNVFIRMGLHHYHY